MGVGWWAESVVLVEAVAQRATASLTGQAPPTGSLAATSQLATASLTGVMQPAGTVAATSQLATASIAATEIGVVVADSQHATASLTATETYSGSIAATSQRGTAAFTGFNPIVHIGTNASELGSCAFAAHQAGDLLLFFAFNDSFGTTPSKPSALGSVPNFTYIKNPPGANSCACTLAYAVATGSGHTSGNWNDTEYSATMVLRNVNASPIGGSAASGGTSLQGATAPAIILSDNSGRSLIAHFFGRKGNYSNTAWSAAPTGYTNRAALDALICVDTKNDTTTDGLITHNTNGSVNYGYFAASVEILAA